MVKELKKRQRKHEDSYMEERNREALKRLAERKKAAENEKPRPSPITGEPMEPEVIHGVVVDRCPSSRGIWLDDGELEQLIDIHLKLALERRKDEGLFSRLFGAKTSD